MKVDLAPTLSQSTLAMELARRSATALRKLNKPYAVPRSSGGQLSATSRSHYDGVSKSIRAVYVLNQKLEAAIPPSLRQGGPTDILKIHKVRSKDRHFYCTAVFLESCTNSFLQHIKSRGL